MHTKTYAQFLNKFFDFSKPIKIVCDASNGTVGPILKETFKNNSKVNLILLNEKPDGNFPAHGPNPLAKGAMDELTRVVLKEKADFGAVFDADADRIFFVDNKGRQLPSFLSSVILFKASKPPFVVDELVFQSMRFLDIFPKKDIFPTKVGSYFVKSKMREKKANVSAEYSGHFYFKDFFYADSGMVALIKMCNFVSNFDQSVSYFLSNLPKFFILTDEIKGKDFKEIKQKIKNFAEKNKLKTENRDGITLVFEDGFLNFRPSNTEPIIRITCGCRSLKEGREKLRIFKNIK